MNALCKALSLIGIYNTNIYDEDIALRALTYSGAAYCSQSSIIAWNCKEPCIDDRGLSESSHIFDYDKKLYGFTGYNSCTQTIVLSFRGT